MTRRPKQYKQPRLTTRTLRAKVVLDYIVEKGPFVTVTEATADLGITPSTWRNYELAATDLLLREMRINEEGVQRIRCKLLYLLSKMYSSESSADMKLKILREIAKLGGLYAPEKIEISSASSIQVHASVQRLLENADELEKSLEQDEQYLSSASAVLLQGENDRSESAQDPANAGADGDAVYS